MWYAKPTGGYANTSTEAQTNASNIAGLLVTQGWSLKSVCALLGNATGESGLNPWRWESDDVPTVSQFQSWDSTQEMVHGYGLFGFTPARNYINTNNSNAYTMFGYAPNFADTVGNATDGQAQTLYFVSTVEQNWSHSLFNYYDPEFTNIGIDISTFYYATFNEFKEAKINGVDMSLADCVGAFELCYEKPSASAAASSYQTRVDSATYWYNYFTTNPPTPVYPTLAQHRLPIWMYAF